MRAIMIMFDTVSRQFLENYENKWVKTPNFKRLEEKCVRFDNFYGGSMPCIPARRELHTGKYNFMHRSWGPLEPFDFSVIEELKNSGIYTHLVTDHSHYFEDGGGTYHTRFNSWEGFRGQEGDRWIPNDYGVVPTNRHPLSKEGISVNHHFSNITRQINEEDMSSVLTMEAGMDFISKHLDKDDWFLQIETFDPHEPFYVPDRFRKIYDLVDDPIFNWPAYGLVDQEENKEALTELRKEYASLLTMCDEYLGKVLDIMDENDMWKDTLLIVNTDHGFLLGEHGFLGKNFGPMYQEVIHIPFFMHVPDSEKNGIRHALGQTVDIAPTLLDYFGLKTDVTMDGHSLLETVVTDKEVRDIAHYGVHGSFSCITDGKSTFMRANVNDDNGPLVESTLMPTHMRGFFNRDKLLAMKLVEGNRYSNGIPFLKIPTHMPIYNSKSFGDQLFDITKDPGQLDNLVGRVDTDEWIRKLTRGLKSFDTPSEELERLGLQSLLKEN